MTKSNPIWQNSKLNIFIPATVNISNILVYYVSVVEYVNHQKGKIADFTSSIPEWKEVASLLKSIDYYYKHNNTYGIFDKVIAFDQDAKIRLDRVLDSWVSIFRSSCNKVVEQVTPLKQELGITHSRVLNKDEIKIFNNWYDYHFLKESSVHRAALQTFLAGDQLKSLANILYMNHPSSHTVLFVKSTKTFPHVHSWIQSKISETLFICAECPETKIIGSDSFQSERLSL